MSDLPVQRFSEMSEAGEDLCCDLPHDRSADSTQRLQQPPLSTEKAQRMAEFLGFLADPSRLRILSILAEQEMCVGELATAVEMNESAVSHQLRTLRTIRLVSSRKQGLNGHFSVAIICKSICLCRIKLMRRWVKEPLSICFQGFC